jgi:hypothetical protein
MPGFENFHIYRHGGYLSKNAGNQFAYPVFFEDPASSFYEGKLIFHEHKTDKPVIGFCGQARGGLKKWSLDVGKGLCLRLLKAVQKWPYDNEKLISTTIQRSKLLDNLEKSPLVQTNFIRRTKYRGGAKTAEEKRENSTEFYANMRQSQYICCYRGVGNYSVRLFETMASGRIPLIIKSDNNLPFEHEIDWGIFPSIPYNKCQNIAQYIADFHSSLSNGQFIFLQTEARRIWEDFLTYKSFMTKWYNKYSTEYRA